MFQCITSAQKGHALFYFYSDFNDLLIVLFLAETFHTLALEGVPRFGNHNRTAAYRFVTLVDVRSYLSLWLGLLCLLMHIIMLSSFISYFAVGNCYLSSCEIRCFSVFFSALILWIYRWWLFCHPAAFLYPITCNLGEWKRMCFVWLITSFCGDFWCVAS